MTVTLRGEVERGVDVGLPPDPHPDTVTFTLTDPSLDDLLLWVERFIVGLGYYPTGHLDYVEEDTNGLR